MRLLSVPIETRRGQSPCQHGLPERYARERRGVEARERMKRITLDVGARHRGIEKAEVKKGIVTNQDRALAIVLGHRATHIAKDALQGIALRISDAKDEWIVRMISRTRIADGASRGIT